jgi:DNA invertase Pin-like site-specific DNA recombinase
MKTKTEKTGITAIYCRTSKKSDTSIEIQKQNGIKFCVSHNFDYQIYIDEAKSGYKISDDDDDDDNLLKYQPQLLILINDIKNGKIKNVWINSHTRLTRKTEKFFLIYRYFKKYKIDLYEFNEKKNYIDPQSKLQITIMDAFSEFERELIVARTTGGLYNAINNGKRAYSSLYGYKKIIEKNENGKKVWAPVESELNNLKIAYEEFLNGTSIRDISYKISLDVKSLRFFGKRLYKLMRHPEYTGYALNMDGLSIFHRYNKLEINNISVLSDIKKYWTPSLIYTQKIISISDYLKVLEKLHSHKLKYNEYTNRNRRAEKGIATGIITCGVCNSQFFNSISRYKNVKKTVSEYRYYKHYLAVKNEYCDNIKTLSLHRTDEYFKAFYFFYYLIYSNSNTLVKDTLIILKNKILTAKNNISNSESSLNKLKKQIANLDEKLSDITNNDIYELTAQKIIDLKSGLSEKINLISENKLELEKLQNIYSKTELENTYINIKDKILNFFNKLSVGDQRNELLNIIKKSCVIQDNHIFINTGNLLFIFNPLKDFSFDNNLLSDLNKDRIYKNYFITKTNKRKTDFFDTVNNYSFLDIGKPKPKNLFLEINEPTEAKKIFKKLNIKYNDIADISKFIFFNY